MSAMNFVMFEHVYKCLIKNTVVVVRHSNEILKLLSLT